MLEGLSQALGSNLFNARLNNSYVNAFIYAYFYFQSIISFQVNILNVLLPSCDEDDVVCGYTNGDCDIFSAVTGNLLNTFKGDVKDINYSSTKVQLGKDILVKIAFGSNNSGRVGKCDIGIWSKTTKKRIFTCVHKNQNLCVYLKVYKNTVFIR